MKILSSRRLLDGEVKVLLDYLAENAQQVEMSVDNIDDWAYDKNFVGKLSHYVGKATLKIKYQSLYEQFTGILHKTQPEPLRAADALHRPHHAPLCGRTMLCGNTGEYLPAGFQTGKLQLRYRRGWQNRNVCRGKEPLLVFFFQCKRPEGYHH